MQHSNHIQTGTVRKKIRKYAMFSAVGVILVIIAATILFDDHSAARDARRLTDMRLITKALAYYYDTHGHYPSQPIVQSECNIVRDTPF